MKVVYNSCYGGFGLSEQAWEWLRERGETRDDWSIPRHSPRLVECVETLGQEAWGPYASLHVAEVAGNRYKINEYDGSETVVEPHDIRWIVVNDPEDADQNDPEDADQPQARGDDETSHYRAW